MSVIATPSRQPPSSSNNRPSSFRCRNTSSTKNGLPSVSSNTMETSGGGAGRPARPSSSIATSSRESASETDLDGQAPAGQVLERARERAAWRDVAGTEARDQEQRDRRAELCESGDELQARLIGPVEVLEAQEQRLAQRGAFDEAPHAVQQVPAFLIGGEHGRFADVVVDAVQLRHQTGDLGGLLAQ